VIDDPQPRSRPLLINWEIYALRIPRRNLLSSASLSPYWLQKAGFSASIYSLETIITANLMARSVIWKAPCLSSSWCYYQTFEYGSRLSASAIPLVELEDKLGDKEIAGMGEKLGKALIGLHVKNLSTVWVDWMYHHSHLTDRRFRLLFMASIPPFSSRYCVSSFFISWRACLQIERLKALEAYAEEKYLGQS